MKNHKSEISLTLVRPRRLWKPTCSTFRQDVWKVSRKVVRRFVLGALWTHTPAMQNFDLIIYNAKGSRQSVLSAMFFIFNEVTEQKNESISIITLCYLISVKWKQLYSCYYWNNPFKNSIEYALCYLKFKKRILLKAFSLRTIKTFFLKALCLTKL